MISQKSKQTDRFALKGLFLSTKHNATANFLQKIIKWKRHFWADALSFTKYQNLQGACSMWRRFKIKWKFLGYILFFNIFPLRKWVSKIFKATFFGKNLLIAHETNNVLLFSYFFWFAYYIILIEQSPIYKLGNGRTKFFSQKLK